MAERGGMRWRECKQRDEEPGGGWFMDSFIVVSIDSENSIVIHKVLLIFIFTLDVEEALMKFIRVVVWRILPKT